MSLKMQKYFIASLFIPDQGLAVSVGAHAGPKFLCNKAKGSGNSEV